MFLQALSSAYMPIGAVLVSPEISDVIYSQSNKLGMIYYSTILQICGKYFGIPYYHKLLRGVFFSIIYLFIYLFLFFNLGSFSHGFTYSGHPVSCAVALESLKVYKYDTPKSSLTHNS